MISDIDSLFALVDTAYAVATDPARWSGFLDMFAQAFDGHLACFEILGTGEALQAEFGVFNAPFLTPALADLYVKHLIYEDQWLQGMLRLETGAICTGSQFQPRHEMLESVMYREYGRYIDVADACGVILDQRVGRAAFLGVYRSVRCDPFGADERRALEIMGPHLRRAYQVQERLTTLAMQHEANLEAIDRLNVGILLAQSGGQVRFANRRAREILGDNDGFALRGGALTASRSDETRRLHALIDAASRRGNVASGPVSGGELSVPRPSLLRPYNVLVAPLRDEALKLDGGPAAAIVFVSDPERQPMAAAAALAHLYGLSRAEAPVAAAAAEGLSAAEIAERIGVSVATIRSHLQRILDKTGTRRQSEFVRMTSQGPARLKMS